MNQYIKDSRISDKLRIKNRSLRSHRIATQYTSLLKLEAGEGVEISMQLGMVFVTTQGTPDSFKGAGVTGMPVASTVETATPRTIFGKVVEFLTQGTGQRR